MGVMENELVHKLLTISPVKSLDDVLQECSTFEATCTTTSAITAPDAVRAMSTYKEKNDVRKTNACGRLHEQQQCPAKESECRDCGKNERWPETIRFPAKGATCRHCSQIGHYD